MYSPQDFLGALERATPESKSQAILALQDGLAKAQKVINAAQELVNAYGDTQDGQTLKLAKALKQYNKV